MALTVADRPVRPLTADDVLRMLEAGILADGERVELLHGVLTAVNAQSPGHVETVSAIHRWLVRSLALDRFELRLGAPFAVPDRTSLPEPDLMVLERRDLRRGRHPDVALLLVEVSWSSLRVDTRLKPALYAAAGVPEYWVADVEARALLVHRDPAASGYSAVERLGPEATLRPGVLGLPPVPVAELLPETAG